MLKRLLSVLFPSTPPAAGGGARSRERAEPDKPRRTTRAKTLAELEAEIEAELDAEAAATTPETERRAQILRRVQEATSGDAEAMAALVRSWMLEDRKTLP
jgi:flagellar biosynthesis/type III secretory pathway M-ring protein FliF/YscJ